MCRFTDAINRTRTKLEAIDQEKSLELDFQDHFEFQQTQAISQAS